MAGQRFGGVLRARRERLQMTQEELAHRAALAVRTIRNLEAGRIRRPRGHSVRQIADALLLDDDARTEFVSLASDDAQPASGDVVLRWVPLVLADVAGFVAPAKVPSALAGALDDAGAEPFGIGIAVVILACTIPCGAPPTEGTSRCRSEPELDTASAYAGGNHHEGGHLTGVGEHEPPQWMDPLTPRRAKGTQRTGCRRWPRRPV
jgi:transcriptional regulator with XRE-family HTH domain